MNLWPTWRGNPVFFITVNLLVLTLIILAFTQAGYIYEKSLQVGLPEPVEHTIVVQGEGRVQIEPDLATVHLGVETSAETVEAAQAENTQRMNALIEEVKAVGIEEKDLQTQQYSVYEDEVWDPETREYLSQGWIVSQQLEVTVRDTDNVSEVLAVAGRNNVTNVWGPNFEVDDPESQLGGARGEAIADARAKAEEIAASLGARLGDVVAFSENTGGGAMPFSRYGFADTMALEEAPAPEIETGTEELTLNVNITYQILGN